MTFFRQYIIPLLVLLGFCFALAVVSVRIFLPSDMAAPAPIEDTEAATAPESGAAGQIPQVNAPTLPTSAGASTIQ